VDDRVYCDNLVSGRKSRTLNLMDGYTRDALRVEVDTSLPGLCVVRVLDRVAQERDLSGAIQMDNAWRIIEAWRVDYDTERHTAVWGIERRKSSRPKPPRDRRLLPTPVASLIPLWAESSLQRCPRAYTMTCKSRNGSCRAILY